MEQGQGKGHAEEGAGWNKYVLLRLRQGIHILSLTRIQTPRQTPNLVSESEALPTDRQLHVLTNGALL